MAGDERENSGVKLVRQSQDHVHEDNGNLDYKKIKRRLDAVCFILQWFENSEIDSDFRASSFLSQIEPEIKDEVCEILNLMNERGDICFVTSEGKTYSGEIDVNQNPRIPLNVLIQLKGQPYGAILYAIELVHSKIAIFEEHYGEIKSIGEQIRQTEGVMRQTAADVKKNIADTNKEVRENIDAFSAELNDRVNIQTAELINKELGREGKIGAFLESIQKDFIQYMAIFIAVFALVNVNLNGLENRSVPFFLSINLSLVASMVTLAALLSCVLHRSKENKINCKTVLLMIFAVILWCITIYVIFIYYYGI